jgi:hypothetical protein
MTTVGSPSRWSITSICAHRQKSMVGWACDKSVEWKPLANSSKVFQNARCTVGECSPGKKCAARGDGPREERAPVQLVMAHGEGETLRDNVMDTTQSENGSESLRPIQSPAPWIRLTGLTILATRSRDIGINKGF